MNIKNELKLIGQSIAAAAVVLAFIVALLYVIKVVVDLGHAVSVPVGG